MIAPYPVTLSPVKDAFAARPDSDACGFVPHRIMAKRAEQSDAKEKFQSFSAPRTIHVDCLPGAWYVSAALDLLWLDCLLLREER